MLSRAFLSEWGDKLAGVHVRQMEMTALSLAFLLLLSLSTPFAAASSGSNSESNSSENADIDNLQSVVDNLLDGIEVENLPPEFDRLDNISSLEELKRLAENCSTELDNLQSDNYLAMPSENSQYLRAIVNNYTGYDFDKILVWVDGDYWGYMHAPSGMTVWSNWKNVSTGYHTAEVDCLNWGRVPNYIEWIIKWLIGMGFPPEDLGESYGWPKNETNYVGADERQDYEFQFGTEPPEERKKTSEIIRDVKVEIGDRSSEAKNLRGQLAEKWGYEAYDQPKQDLNKLVYNAPPRFVEVWSRRFIEDMERFPEQEEAERAIKLYLWTHMANIQRRFIFSDYCFVGVDYGDASWLYNNAKMFSNVVNEIAEKMTRWETDPISKGEDALIDDLNERGMSLLREKNLEEAKYQITNARDAIESYVEASLRLKIRGRLVDAEGRGLKDKTIILSWTEGGKQEKQQTETSENGSFSFEVTELWGGEYKLKFESDDEYLPTSTDPPLIWYLQVSENQYRYVYDNAKWALCGTTFESAPVSGSENYVGFLDNYNHANFRKCYFEEGDEISLSMTPHHSSDYDFRLYDPDRDLLASSTARGQGLTEEISYTAGESGYHYVEIERISGGGRYDISVAGVTEKTPPQRPVLDEIWTGGGWSKDNNPCWVWISKDPESGISEHEVYRSWDNQTFLTTGENYSPFLEDGVHRIRVRAKNDKGMWSDWSFRCPVYIDTRPPESSVDRISPYWQSENAIPIDITATVGDPSLGGARTSGVENVGLYYRYSTDNSSWTSWRPYGIDENAPYSWRFRPPENDGYYEFYSQATDGAGNRETPPSDFDERIGVDTTPPESSANPVVPFWREEIPFEVSASASDDWTRDNRVVLGSGVENTWLYYRSSVDNESWSSWSLYDQGASGRLSWSFNAPDDYVLYQFQTISVDAVGNLENFSGVADATGGAVIPAEIDVNPRTLNLKSRGRWVTAHIELPEGYDPENIGVSTVSLNGVPAENNPKHGFVKNPKGGEGDDPYELMVKFDRFEVGETLEAGDNVRVTVTGRWQAVRFEVDDALRVIDPGGGKSKKGKDSKKR